MKVDDIGRVYTDTGMSETGDITISSKISSIGRLILQGIYSTILSEGITVTASKYINLSRSLVENISIRLNITKTHVRDYLESISIADNKVSNITRYIIDGITFIDSLIIGFFIFCSETINISNNITRNILRNINENIYSIDNIIKITIRNINESLTSIDYISRSTIKHIQETITLNLLIVRSLVKKIVQNIIVSDTVQKVFAIVLNLSETISISFIINKLRPQTIYTAISTKVTALKSATGIYRSGEEQR